MKTIAIDTETALIQPGRLAPPLVCTSWASQDYATVIPHDDPYPILLVEGEFNIVGHNVAYDLAVWAEEWPDLLPTIFQALSENRITDTGLRQKLIDIALGQYRGYTNAVTDQYVKHEYSLAALSERILNKELPKDEHRLEFGSLRNVPIEKWPEGRASYAITDARTTYDIWAVQEKDHKQFLEDQYRQTRAAFALHLISCWGIRTDPKAIERLALEVGSKHKEAIQRCKNAGLVRTNGTRDTKEARRYMLEVCDSLGVLPKRTAKYRELKLKLEHELTDREIKSLADPIFGVSMDEDACLEVGDELLKSYTEVTSLTTVVDTHIPALRNGIKLPIQPRFDPLMATGRTSCKGHSSKAPTNGYQMQNVRRLPGIRECFIPRSGKLFCSADYDGLELRTVSQVCLWSVGFSKLAEALNSGIDVHTDLGAMLLGDYYDQFKQKIEEGDKEAKDARQFAKVGNFGFWGLMQPSSFRQYARSMFEIRRTLKECEELHEAWHSKWPESHEYFNWIKAQCNNSEGLASIKHFGSNRHRGLIPATVCSNTFFQALGADATKDALFHIQKECYTDCNTPLYGCRIVNYVHDEFIIEVNEDLDVARAAAKRLVEVMCDCAGKWIPDVPPSASACLLTRWSKDAKPVYDEQGDLLPWVWVPDENNKH